MKKNILMFAFFLALVNTALAQQRIITGVVTDANGVPLIGVNIIEQETTNGTTSDFDGNYTISVNTGRVLVFSYLGMITQTITVTSSNTINVTMEESADQLEQVVITAFGIKREKRALGYATQELKGNEFTEARETNIANSLAGKIAGVHVSNIATGAGGSSRIVIRGNSSISGNDSPLFVVDGIPIDNQNLDPANYAAGGVDYGDGIGGINPDDVESITVLKGPNAAALYGARAANGVILITTKSGTAQEGLGITLNSNVTIDAIATFPNFQTKFGPGFGADLTNRGTTTIDGVEYPVLNPRWTRSFGPALDGTLVADWADPTKILALVPQPADNLKNLFKTGYTATNTIAISSGGEKTSLRLSISDLKNEGILPGSTFEQQTISFRGKANITNKFSLDAKVNYIHHIADNRPSLAANSSNVMNQIIQFPRHINLDRLKDYKDVNGEPISFSSRFENPYWTINEIQNNDERNRIIGMFSLKYDLSDWLSVQARTGTDFYTDVRFSRMAIGTRAARTGLVSNYTWQVKENNSDVLIMANKDFSENLSWSLNMGASHLSSSREVTGFKGVGLRAPGLYQISNASEVTPRNQKTKRVMNSVFAAGQLAYKNYLFLDVTGRNDWSSVLGINNFSFFYPSITTSLVFTDAFDLKSDVLGYGKLRAGYSEVGNDSSPFLTSLGYNTLTQTINGQGQAVIQNRIPNINLKNELTQSFEFGVEFRLFKNRVGLDFTYYNSSSKNQILPVNISSGTGFNSLVINAGEITNEGVEFMLNFTPIKIQNSLKWDVIFNFAKNKSKVVSLANGIETHQMSRDRWGTIEARPGEDFGNIVGFYYKRNEKGEKLLDSNGFYQRDGNNVKILGNIQPDWIGGLTNSFSYKGFTLSALIDIKMGGELLSGTKYNLASKGTGLFTIDGIYQNEAGNWVGVSDGVMENDYFIDGVLHLAAGEKSDIELPRFRLAGQLTNVDIIEEFVLDASYIMLREVSLGYTFPKSILKRTPFTRARISIVGRNLLYIDENMQGLGISPEAAFSSASGSQGSESYTLPSTRSFGINLNIAF